MMHPSHVPCYPHLPGIVSELSKERRKEATMMCKLTDKNMESLSGDVDADLGLALPGSSGTSAAKSGVKEEMPSLPIIQAEIKAGKRTYMLHT